MTLTMKLEPTQEPARREAQEVARAPGAVRNPGRVFDPLSGLKAGSVVQVRILGIAQGFAARPAAPTAESARGPANPSPTATTGRSPTAGTAPAAPAPPPIRPGGAVPLAGAASGEHLMLVEIRGRTLVAQTPAGIPPGTTFEARLERPEGSVPRLVPEPKRDLARAAPAEARYRDAVELAHPHRRSVKALSSLVPRLTTLAAAPGAPDRAASLAPLQNAVSRLVSALPKPASLGDPVALKTAVALRGTGYESAVRDAAMTRHGAAPPVRPTDPARAGHPPAPGGDPRAIADHDLKPLLMRVRDAAVRIAEAPSRAGELPPTGNAEGTPRTAAPTGTDPLPRLAEAIGRTAVTMLAQIEVQQLVHVTEPAEGARLIDLPLWPDERLQGMEIEFDQHGQPEHRRWEASHSLKLRLELGGFGELNVIVDFRPGEVDGATPPAIGARFLTRTAALAETLQAELPALRNRLERNGFSVTGLSSEPGKAPERWRPRNRELPLIDVET